MEKKHEQGSPGHHDHYSTAFVYFIFPFPRLDAPYMYTSQSLYEAPALP
jgi:hypothetical protein